MEKKEKIKVLYIDDEENNLIGFKATFRQFYQVLVANSAEEGIRILDAHPDIIVVLCDHRMPETTGVEFFQEIVKTHPAPVRMLVTGYIDIQSVIEGINKGHIFRYIEKPWKETDVQSAIEEGYKYYTMVSMLNVKNEQLSKAYDELDKFAYSVTHDMRGPIVSVLGAIDIAKSTDSISETREILTMMEKSVQRIEAFIRNMHEYYSLKRGELEIKEVDFNEVIKDLKELHEVSATIENIRFQVSLEQKEQFRSDDLSIKIVLNNLLSNAFKYQRASEVDKFVELEIKVLKGEAIFVVRDNGIGIDENYKQDIFKMFFRATTESTGSGFGLYNVKDAVQKLNGKITLTSQKNEGTTFTVTIPNK